MVLYEPEVGPEYVRDVRVSLGEGDQGVEELAHAGAAAALINGYPQPPESRVLDPSDHLERGCEIALARLRAGCDALQELIELW